MRALNRMFRGKDVATDVLSFPAEGGDPAADSLQAARGEAPSLGDIVIASGVATRQAREHGHALGTELRVLALHGLLHLLGYDHETDEGRMARAELRLQEEGRPALGPDRPRGCPSGSHPTTRMTPLLLFLLGCAATYLGTVTAAFSALMELSLRIMAEGSGRHDRLGRYLDDPRRLFIPARLLLGIIPVLATALLARVTGVDQAGFPLLVLSVVAFVLFCEHVIPLIIVRRDPERVLDVLLPSFDAVARLLSPLTRALLTVGHQFAAIRARPPTAPRRTTARDEASSNGAANGEPEPLQEGQARELLRTLVDFRETMVREVMTPRPDIVAVNANATLEQLQNLFREQQYSRVPVYQDTLDNVVGFVFVKDLIHQAANADPQAPITPLVRPAHFVPETKRVVDLLREFQRNRLQMAIVVDEYGGTAGSGHARGPDRGDRRRDPRRVRRRSRAGGRRGRRRASSSAARSTCRS